MSNITKSGLWRWTMEWLVTSFSQLTTKSNYGRGVLIAVMVILGGCWRDLLIKTSFFFESTYDGSPKQIVGISEEDNVFFLQTKSGIFKVNVESMQHKKVSEVLDTYACHSFTSVYTAGLGVDGGED